MARLAEPTDNGSISPGPEDDTLLDAIAMVLFVVLRGVSHRRDDEIAPHHLLRPSDVEPWKTALQNFVENQSGEDALRWQRVGHQSQLILESLMRFYDHTSTEEP